MQKVMRKSFNRLFFPRFRLEMMNKKKTCCIFASFVRFILFPVTGAELWQRNFEEEKYFFLED